MAVSKWIKKRDKTNRAGQVTGQVWRATYVDDAGKEHSKHFDRKVDAARWVDAAVADLVRGEHIDPAVAETTVGQWCELWLEGYGTRRASTVRQARTHIVHIRAGFEDVPLRQIRPSAVNHWTAGLRAEGLAQSYVHAIYRRFAQLLADAQADGLIARNPISKRTSVPTGDQHLYFPDTQEVWDLYASYPEHLRPAVVLGAFAGLREAEVCGMRTTDVDFLRKTITPALQYPAEPLKNDCAKWMIPVSSALIDALAGYKRDFPSQWLLCDHLGHQVGPWTLQRAQRAHRSDPAFRFHDLRHYFASMLIASGHDIKTVQQRMRHKSATTTLDTYSHLWPASDERTRDTVDAIFAARTDPRAPENAPKQSRAKAK